MPGESPASADSSRADTPATSRTARNLSRAVVDMATRVADGYRRSKRLDLTGRKKPSDFLSCYSCSHLLHG